MSGRIINTKLNFKPTFLHGLSERIKIYFTFHKLRVLRLLELFQKPHNWNTIKTEIPKKNLSIFGFKKKLFLPWKGQVVFRTIETVVYQHLFS